MFQRLIIIGCCALGGFALGRWLSPPAGASAALLSDERRTADSQVAAPVKLPPPQRAGRVPFVDLYRSLRSFSPEEHAAYLRSLQTLPNGPDRRAALTAFFQCMSSISPQAAADLVRQVGKDDLERAVQAVLGATAASQTPVLVKMLLDLPADTDPRWREQMLSGQMFFWAALDPTAAAQFADQYRSIYPNLAVAGIVQCLAVTDPAAAERWLQEHPDLAKQPEVMSGYLKGLYQGDPASARRYLTEHATEEVVQSGLKGVARLTFLSSADDATEFISHLPTKDARRAALDGILDLNTEAFVNNETSHTALCAGLAEWITKFSPEDWPNSMSGFLRQWRELDPEGSVRWMARLPSHTRSAIASELGRDLAPEELKQVLATTDGDLHRDVLAALAGRRTLTPEELESLIEELELSPEDAVQFATPGR